MKKQYGVLLSFLAFAVLTTGCGSSYETDVDLEARARKDVEEYNKRKNTGSGLGEQSGMNDPCVTPDAVDGEKAPPVPDEVNKLAKSIAKNKYWLYKVKCDSFYNYFAGELSDHLEAGVTVTEGIDLLKKAKQLVHDKVPGDTTKQEANLQKGIDNAVKASENEDLKGFIYRCSMICDDKDQNILCFVHRPDVDKEPNYWVPIGE